MKTTMTMMRAALSVSLILATVTSPGTAQDTRASIEVPLRVVGTQLVVTVTGADHRSGDFILSTANGQTVFSESFAAHQGDAELWLGEASVNLDDVQTIADDKLMNGNRQLDGMIGANTLNQFDVLVDVPGNRLVLKPFGRSVEWPGMVMSEPVPVRLYHGLYVGLDVEFDSRPYAALLDLGVSSLVVNAPVGISSGIESEGTAELSLGTVTLSGLPVRVLDLPLFGGFDPDGDGFVVVGAPIALECALSISWIHQEVRMCVQ